MEFVAPLPAFYARGFLGKLISGFVLVDSQGIPANNLWLLATFLKICASSCILISKAKWKAFGLLPIKIFLMENVYCYNKNCMSIFGVELRVSVDYRLGNQGRTSVIIPDLGSGLDLILPVATDFSVGTI